MARRKKPVEHENHERWLVSYADFITLLFAFFVVMYSISSVNEGKYRVLSDSMVTAFKSSAKALQPIQVGEITRQNSPEKFSPVIQLPFVPTLNPIVLDSQMPARQQYEINDAEWALDEAAAQVNTISEDVEGQLAEMLEDDLLSMRKNRLSLEIEINTSFLFVSGSADPSIDAEIILSRLARVLAQYPNKLHVEGYTDNLPISNSVYPSNWELSSARSAAVVRLFAQYGIQPERMTAVGYGEFKPQASNESPIGRAQNRRVVIVVMANLGDDGEYSYSDFDVLEQQLLSTPAVVE